MKPHRPRFAAARAALFASAAVVALLAACQAELPTATEVANMDAKTAAEGARKVRLVGQGDSGMVYVVDGVRMNAKDAESISPDRIASIEIAKHPADRTQGGTISIRTRTPGDTGKAHDLLFVREGMNAASQPTGEMRFRKFGGIVIVDGKQVDEAAMNRIPPADILSVEVIKGPEAAKLYPSAEAEHGVIRITTKQGAAKQ